MTAEQESSCQTYDFASGLAKILYPNKKLKENDLRVIMDLSLEYKEKIADLLHRMTPGEFEEKRIRYKLKT